MIKRSSIDVICSTSAKSGFICYNGAMEQMDWIIVWLGLALMGAILLSRYRKAGTGFLLGLFLGPVGVLIAAFLRRKHLRQLNLDDKPSPRLVELILPNRNRPK